MFSKYNVEFYSMVRVCCNLLNELYDFHYIGSQNLLPDDVGTHCEATDGTVNISNDLPPSPTHVTPPLRIELIGNTTSIE